MTPPASARECLERLARQGTLHPANPSAEQIRSTFDSLGQSGEPRAALFMAQAHLLGGWIPLLRHAPEKLPQGPSLLALAATERESGADLYSLRTSAERLSDGWKLSGEKVFITNGPIASHFLILVRTASAPPARSMSCFLVERGQAGLFVEPMPALMGMQEVSIGALRLEGAVVSEETLVGAPGEGAAFFRTAMCWERSLILTPSPGVLERLLELVLAEAKQKHRMGLPLPEQPLFRRRVREVHSAILELRKRGKEAARALDSGQNAVLSAMETKLSCSRLYESASRILLQLGGARAYLSGSELESNFRDSLASSIYSGPNEVLELALEKTRNEKGKL